MSPQTKLTRLLAIAERDLSKSYQQLLDEISQGLGRQIVNVKGLSDREAKLGIEFIGMMYKEMAK